VGVASLIGSGILFGLRQSTLSDLENKCGTDGKSCPGSARGEIDNLKLYNTTAQVALGVGVLGVGTALTWIVLQKKQNPTSAGFLITPDAPNALAGASLSGRF
jgi:hypothetical protein